MIASDPGSPEEDLGHDEQEKLHHHLRNNADFFETSDTDPTFFSRSRRSLATLSNLSTKMLFPISVMNYDPTLLEMLLAFLIHRRIPVARV